MLAHYRYPIEYVLDGMSIIQVFVLFEAMSDYIIMTTPGAQSAGDGPSGYVSEAGRTVIDRDASARDSFAAASFFAREFGGAVTSGPPPGVF